MLLKNLQRRVQQFLLTKKSMATRTHPQCIVPSSDQSRQLCSYQALDRLWTARLCPDRQLNPDFEMPISICHLLESINNSLDSRSCLALAIAHIRLPRPLDPSFECLALAITHIPLPGPLDSNFEIFASYYGEPRWVRYLEEMRNMWNSDGRTPLTFEGFIELWRLLMVRSLSLFF